MSVNKDGIRRTHLKNATIEHKINWHLKDLKRCGHRTDLPEKITEEKEKRHIKDRYYRKSDMTTFLTSGIIWNVLV